MSFDSVLFFDRLMYNVDTLYMENIVFGELEFNEK